jgi:hypothetical protein
VLVLRPASGLAPSHRAALVGSTVSRDITAGAAFVAADVAVLELT